MPRPKGKAVAAPDDTKAALAHGSADASQDASQSSMIAGRLVELEDQKKLAIMRDDLVLAQQIKEQMERLRLQDLSTPSSSAPQSAAGAQFTLEQRKSPEEVLKENRLWEGWAKYHTLIPLGPGKELQLPARETPDPDVVGFAVPLSCVEYALRNERKYPPPSEEDQYREMFKLIHQTLKLRLFKRSYTMSIIYNHINRNKRDSPGWQKGFIKAKGPQELIKIWKDPEPAEGKRVLGDRYWVMAIFGRMLGTSEDSRRELLRLGIVDKIVEGTSDEDPNVQDCALCGLKALIQFPEGRTVVSYDLLISCLNKRTQKTG
jgi:hypothetical protein